SAIEDCSRPAALRSDKARRRLRARRLGKRAACRVGFAFAGGREEGLLGTVEPGDAQLHAVDKRFEACLGRKNALPLLEGRRARKKGRNVSIRPDSEKLEVEDRVGELAFVVRRSRFLAEL